MSGTTWQKSLAGLNNMRVQNIQQMVLTYFRGVDEQNIGLIFDTLTSDCTFRVESHGVELTGHDAIAGMFDRLWSHHQWVRHDKFHFITDISGTGVAVRFRVTNKLHDGSLVYKSNCNFFTLGDEKFSTVRVYMAGENTLDSQN